MTILPRKFRRALRPLKSGFKNLLDAQAMRRLPLHQCQTEALRALSQDDLKSLFDGSETHDDWHIDECRLREVNPPDYSDGVNPGDQRALHYLVRKLKASRILEVGTHIGSSTLSLALAAARSHSEDTPARIVTVDIRDVNDETTEPWRQFGSDASPRQKLSALGLDHLVEFRTGDSLQILSGLHKEFDMIFLDGNHRAPAVYREIPLALKCLVPGGSIVMHDYFPDGKPLWQESPAILGPWQAVKRLLDEGADMRVIPLGELPWETKWQSHTTSLAILSRPA